MKNHEKPKFNDYVKELQSQEKSIFRREMINFLREKMSCSMKLSRGESIWYGDDTTETQLVRGVAKKDVDNKKRICRKKNVPNTVSYEQRCDENHEFDVVEISELKEKLRGRQYKKKHRKSTDGDRQLCRKKEAKLRKVYLQASDYKTGKFLLAS